MKDIDTVRNAHILKYFLLVFFFLAILGLVLKGILGVLIAIPVSAAVSMFSVMISDLIGGGVSLLYGTGRRNIDVRDQFSGTMSQARYQKMNKHFDEALLLIEEVLDKDPDYSEALFLKAQILWEGFERYAEAKNCLRKVIKTGSSGDETIFRWASALNDDLSKIDRFAKRSEIQNESPKAIR